MNGDIVNMSVKNRLLVITLMFCVILVGVVIYAADILVGDSGAAVKMGWGLAILFLLLGTWFSIYVRSSIIRSITQMTIVTNKIAAGDLSAENDMQLIDTQDECGVLAESHRSMLSAVKKLHVETVSLAENVRRGNLQVQCAGDEFEGVWSDIIGEINSVIASYVVPFREASIYLDRISHGDIPPVATKKYPGDFDKFKEGFNRCILVISDLLAEYNSLIDAAHSGDLTARGDANKYEGCWQEFIDGLNKIVETSVDPVRSAGEVLHGLSEGDLRYVMDGEYQGDYAALQNSVNTTVKKIESTVIPVQKMAGFIARSANQISAGNMSLSSRTDKESTSLQETASSMERLIGAVRNNAENSKHANDLATEAKRSAEHGGEVVSRAVQAMDEINKSSNKISEIIGVIDDIAFQTNLLALNASVEAARAGEQGRGFAVVATEVRNLAGRSATAAKEIKDLIKDSMKKVQAGTSLVNDSGETLDEITDGVKQVSSIISDINVVSTEQLEGIEVVNKAITSMDDMVEQNALLAEKTSVASGSMKEKAKELEELMRFFKVNRPVVQEDDQLTDLDEVPARKYVPEEPAAKVRNSADEEVKNIFVPPKYAEDDDEWEEF